MGEKCSASTRPRDIILPFQEQVASPVFKSFSRIHYAKHVCDRLSIRSSH